MACFHPVSGYRVRGGQIKFCRPGQWFKDMLKVSCGQCVGCKAERARQWGVRGMHELAMTSDQDPTTPLPLGSFLTLTYAEEHLPENGQLTKLHWQNFAKELRTKVGPFRFLMCGEYGPRGSERCHFHAAIFGIDFVTKQPTTTRTFFKNNEQGQPLYVSPVLASIWRKGTHLIGDVTFDSVNYVAGYIQKKVNGDKKKAHYTRINTDTGEVFDRVPEFGLMSRGGSGPNNQGGIGQSWIKKFHADVYPADEVIVNGISAQPPLYYDRWYEKNYPTEWEAVKLKRKTNGKINEEDNTPARLAVKKKVFTSKRASYRKR